MWLEILTISLLERTFQNLPYHVEQNELLWKKLQTLKNPLEFEFPKEFKLDLTDFKKMVILKTFRPDKVVELGKWYIAKKLGKKFLNPPRFDLKSIFQNTQSRTPTIFLLTPGVDPFNNLKLLADEQQIELNNISLGQGQGPIALKLIKLAIENGSWIVLQNCHLAKTFMKDLEQTCQNIRNKDLVISPNFRIWLTTYPTPIFPLSILQNSLKLTNEPPKGLKSNLLGSLNNNMFKENNLIEQNQQQAIFSRLIYAICFFHAVIQERKQFGALGWNIPYEFTESDLRISIKQIDVFLNKVQKEIPLDALNYLISECNYGGRVTDDKDRRLIKTILRQFLNVKMLTSSDYLIDQRNQNYGIPTFFGYESILNYAQQLTEEQDPGILGFHPNARITKDINESNLFLNTILVTQSGGNNTSKNNQNKLQETINNLISEIPELINLEMVRQNYPIIQEESMNTILQQECSKFNNLLKTIKTTLQNILNALQGFQIFTTQLEDILSSIMNGKVPQFWLQVSYPSLKPLSSYISNLKRRIEYFNDWIVNGKPLDFWISAFFFTQGFLTSVMQNYSRQKVISIDQISFEVKVVQPDFKAEEKSFEEIFIHGMFLEGASFDYQRNILCESKPRVLFLENFRAKLIPTGKIKDDVQSFEGEGLYQYHCPLYRTVERRGELLTTGHSTNFVISLQLPSNVEEEKWIRRGVALLLELSS